MLIAIPEVEIPDECPKDCVYKKDLVKFGQDAECFRCPIFNCGGKLPMLRPDQYRYNWAIEWKKFFDGSIDAPCLPL